MKILFLSAANSIHTVRWVNSLANRNHEIYLVYNRGHNPKADKIDKKVKLCELPFTGNRGYFFNVFALKKLAKKIKPDVINVHYASGYGTLARLAGFKQMLLSIWGSDVYDFPYESKIKKKILEKNVRYAKEIASTSFCMAEQLRKVINEENLPIHITPFGVDTNLFDPYAYKEEQKDTIVIGNIKLLAPKYGIKETILAFEKLLKDEDIKKSGKSIVLEIYGDGEQKQELEHLIRDKELQDCVFLKGRIPNTQVPATLKHIDIFCAFSQLNSESFGVAVVEAMAMEVPVVVSDADGLKEVVKTGKTGYVIQRKDIEGCKEALKELVLDQSLRNEFGKNGRKRVEEYYNWENNVTTMEEIYENLYKE
ncbi:MULTISPECIES: glycosyltransferase [Lachnospiraceae]|uniref:Glycosyltransferase n=1 Tax=Faecalicatena acetigenes TaxID=2981790 RepID=A0ABT2TDH1_9FIRM|nr:MULTISPECIES: glycosyltransferase [Lachnospiraceae]MCU6747759.1 glycosyltransferase [Faecalicatena acetigenes]SCI07761.1 GDP-mannose-dependent alpha-(1-6)-phosphatidylinositol monomannoside mannosyltransferase [uncultured Clostridium sp.]